MYVLSLRFPGSSRQMNSTRRSSPPGHLTVMGQKGGRGDAKYATGSVSNKRGRQLRKSRRVFPRKNRVFQHATPWNLAPNPYASSPFFVNSYDTLSNAFSMSRKRKIPFRSSGSSFM